MISDNTEKNIKIATYVIATVASIGIIIDVYQANFAGKPPKQRFTDKTIKSIMQLYKSSVKKTLDAWLFLYNRKTSDVDKLPQENDSDLESPQVMMQSIGSLV